MSNSYPGQLQRLLGRGYEVRNFGVNGATLLANGDYPYIETPAFKEAVSFDPHIVLFMLGTNDTKKWNWKKNESFIDDGLALLNRHVSVLKCFVCLPTPAFPENFGIRDEMIVGEVIPQLREIAKLTGAEVLDLHTPFLEKAELFPDGVHPSAEACAEVARITAAAIGRAAG